MNRKFASIQEQIERSDSYFARMWRWVWLKLQVWIPTDEPMLRQLRNESSVVLAYPSHWTSERAMTSWRDYLWRRRLIAAIWVAFYVILAPVVTLVAFLPGPNVLGYWFLYRGVCDGLTVWGTHRGLRLWPPQTEIIDGQPESGSGIIAALKMEPASHPAPTPVAAETSNQERS